MPALISDLWNPAIWVQGMRERQATYPSALNAGVMVSSPFLDGIATGAGTSVNIPFLKDITDQADEVQIEDTAPTTDNGQTSGLNVATVLNRVTKNSVTALAAQVSGADPVGGIIGQLVARRLKQRQTTLIAMLRGLFASAGAANAAAALSANRYGGTTAEIFTETAVGQTAANKISAAVFINAKALLGELADELKNGIFLVHPNIRAALEVLDADGFKNGVPSDLKFTVTTYREIPIFTSSALVRAGTTSGYVYDSYLLTRGIVGYGEKPQAGDVIDVASLCYEADKAKNNEIIYDRTRFLMHVDGTKWVGTPAAQSATNAELQTAANWELAYTTANRIGAVCLRTNG